MAWWRKNPRNCNCRIWLVASKGSGGIIGTAAVAMLVNVQTGRLFGKSLQHFAFMQQDKKIVTKRNISDLRVEYNLDILRKNKANTFTRKLFISADVTTACIRRHFLVLSAGPVTETPFARDKELCPEIVSQ
ncbi:hypothetical protein ACJJTC_010097 [Scirpophaga incertulas]